jgi:hypothetical protein
MNVLNIYEMFEYLLHRLNNQFVSTINCILLNNQQLLVELFQMYTPYNNSRTLSPQLDIQYDASDEMKPTSVKVFETFIKFLCHMLHMCDLNVRIQLIQSLKSSMKLIFHSDMLLRMETEDSLMLNPEYQPSTTLQTSNPVKGVKLEEEDSAKGRTYLPIRSLVSRIKAISSGSKDQPGLLSRRASGATLPPLSSVRSIFDSDTERHEYLQASNENPESYQQTSRASDQEEGNNFSIVFANKTDFLKACILYREMCCVLGNTTMREAVLNSRVFEDYLSQIPEKSEEKRAIKPEENNFITVEEELLNEKQSHSGYWFLQSPSTMQRIITSAINYENDVRNSEYRLKGVLEYEFEDVKSGISQSTIRCIHVLDRDERIFVTGGRDNNLPCIKFWNLESESSHPNSTFYPYPNVSSKREITKVQFLDPTDGRIVVCNDTNFRSSFGNLHIFDCEMNKLLFTIHGGGPNQYWYFNHNTPSSQVQHPLLQHRYSTSAVIDVSKQGTSNYIIVHRNSVASIPININTNLISSTAAIPSGTLSSGSHIYTAAANLDPYPGQISSFDVMPQDSNLIATATSDCKIKFYDIRMNGMRECYEWRIFPPNYQFLKNSYPTLTSISACHTQDKLISIGLSTGVVCLMERRSGLVVDSFQAHEKEVNKIIPYKSCAGHIFTCSGAIDAKSDLLRMWNIQSSGSAKCERVFKFNPAYWQQLSQYHDGFQPQVTVKSFDVHSKTESDHVFAITNYSILQYRSSSLISSPFDSDYTENKVPQQQYTSGTIKRRNNSTTQNVPNMYMNVVYNQQQQQPAIDFSTITCAPVVNNTNSTTPVSTSTPSTSVKFTDVKYFPLHKLLLVTTSGGKVQVFS